MSAQDDTNSQEERGAARNHAPLRLTGLLCLAACLAGPAAAASPWSSLAKMISPKAPVRRVAAQESANNKAALAVIDEDAPTTSGQSGGAIQGMPPAPKPPAEALPAPRPGAVGLTFPTDMLGKVEKVDLGRESEESETMLATNLFKNPDIRHLLGEEPHFLYDPADRPDPMLVPWVRRAAIFKELAAQADALMLGGSLDQAVGIYNKILEMNDPRFNALVQAKLTEINKKQQSTTQAAVQMALVADKKVELPAWVRDNTTGVIVSERPVCLIGEYMLHVGEGLPNYPEIKVASIEDKRVVFRIMDKTFEVLLNQEP